MHALPAHTVKLALEYICPLSGPLPPHLLSTPLRQRHHFLQISPASPAEYLCWPSPDDARIIALLDRLPPPSDQASYPTRYTSDPESTFAHVQISSDPNALRMLFHWDDTHAWQYHDLQLMPFPSASFSTPRESLAASSVSGGYFSHSPLDPVPEANQAHSDSDDTYWDSYGAPGNHLTSPSLPRNASDGTVGEDAYWAQYASVQGSADSTVPSPLPANRQLRPADSNHDESAFPFRTRNDAIIDLPADAFRSRPRLTPPSPSMLTHLLSTISPRSDISSPLDDPCPLHSPSGYSTNPSPEQTMADSELTTPPQPDEYLHVPAASPVPVKVVRPPPCRPHPLYESEDKALTEGIKALYYLWKTGRKRELGGKDKKIFLQIVQEAIVYE